MTQVFLFPEGYKEKMEKKKRREVKETETPKLNF